MEGPPKSEQPNQEVGQENAPITKVRVWEELRAKWMALKCKNEK